MSQRQTSAHDNQPPGRYRLRLQGQLDDRWAGWFDGLEITRTANGDTLLTGPVPDQAALHGLLRKVRDLGLPLLEVCRLEPPTTDAPQADP